MWTGVWGRVAAAQISFELNEYIVLYNRRVSLLLVKSIKSIIPIKYYYFNTSLYREKIPICTELCTMVEEKGTVEYMTSTMMKYAI